MKGPKDKELSKILFVVFGFSVAVISFLITLLIGWIFPKLPWEKLGGLFIYGVGSFVLTIYATWMFFREFQKRMIGLQILTAVILFILYFIGIAFLIVQNIIKIPSNTWAYIGIFLIFGVFILYPALRIEYEFLIKKYLIKKRKKSKRAKTEQKVNEEDQKEENSNANNSNLRLK